jgi:hypothetical protein
MSSSEESRSSCASSSGDRFAKPLEDLLGDVFAERALDAAEHACEHPVVGIEVGLALDQARATEMIEAKQARPVKPLLEGREECLPLLE